MTPERIAELLDTFQAAVTDMIEARAVGDAEDEFSRVNTLRMGFLMQMQPLLSAADENAKLRDRLAAYERDKVCDCDAGCQLFVFTEREAKLRSQRDALVALVNDWCNHADAMEKAVVAAGGRVGTPKESEYARLVMRARRVREEASDGN